MAQLLSRGGQPPSCCPGRGTGTPAARLHGCAGVSVFLCGCVLTDVGLCGACSCQEITGWKRRTAAQAVASKHLDVPRLENTINRLETERQNDVENLNMFRENYFFLSVRANDFL